LVILDFAARKRSSPRVLQGRHGGPESMLCELLADVDRERQQIESEDISS